jgi:hypothetical protein
MIAAVQYFSKQEGNPMTTKTRTVDDKANEAIRNLVAALPAVIFAKAIAKAFKRTGASSRSTSTSGAALQSQAR